MVTRRGFIKNALAAFFLASAVGLERVFGSGSDGLEILYPSEPSGMIALYVNEHGEWIGVERK